ncbi:GNAT family N-acetyltransferase [Alkaliphilus pronyensis]|uniref:GNAT family N-acetyltransferase n=1 Tax=Alkaliphilus pronyensis TaxID=1482732 RepID=A0A6I0F2M1_9FIRM|nr:GNAT family N-acetyltransferase [Alkaliphilus pronyensis]KAB3532135.1 GNAT family N-acetyltransferase [Alkaliphilus pronyensis]
MITIEKGFDQKNRHRAAQLYSKAFERKFAKVIGKEEVIEVLLERVMNPNCSFGAYNTENKLIGLVGYHVRNQMLISISPWDFIKTFGLLSGFFKAILAHIIFHRKADNEKQLLMDGIAVDATCRGQGVGTLLFNTLITFAKSEGYESIKLDVIDENPKAKALYERLGFVQKEYKKLPRLVAVLIGVKGVTTMVLSLEPPIMTTYNHNHKNRPCGLGGYRTFL